jgi:hypothetical protein
MEPDLCSDNKAGGAASGRGCACICIGCVIPLQLRAMCLRVQSRSRILVVCCWLQHQSCVRPYLLPRLSCLWPCFRGTTGLYGCAVVTAGTVAPGVRVAPRALKAVRGYCLLLLRDVLLMRTGTARSACRQMQMLVQQLVGRRTQTCTMDRLPHHQATYQTCSLISPWKRSMKSVFQLHPPLAARAAPAGRCH